MHGVVLPLQRELDLLERPRAAAGLQVPVVHGGRLDLDAPGGKPVEVERRAILGSLALAEQPDAAVREAHDRDGRANEPHSTGDQFAGTEQAQQVDGDRALAGLEQRLGAILVQHTDVAQHDLGPEPAQPRVDAGKLHAQVGLLLDPVLQAGRVLGDERERESQRAKQQRGCDQHASQKPGQQPPGPGGGAAPGSLVHMSTTSYWSGS